MRVVKILVGIIGLIIIVGVVYQIVLDSPCRKLRKQGFWYKMEGGFFSTWDIVNFYFYIDEGKAGVGPEIAGDRLKVSCRDIDKDGVAEFIIQSQIWKTYRTILKVDPDAGGYHVQYTNGLGVGYPQEGYHYR